MVDKVKKAFLEEGAIHKKAGICKKLANLSTC